MCRVFVCLPARRDAVQEVLKQVSPAITSTQATLLVKCDKTELKTQMMMVDNDIKDLVGKKEICQRQKHIIINVSAFQSFQH